MFEAARDFLDNVYRTSPRDLNDAPLVTLTFAQSLDGKISRHGEQLLLSGKESMAMTHRYCNGHCNKARHLSIRLNRLRTLHDGIMVGIGTVLTDNPQLNGNIISYKSVCVNAKRSYMISASAD